MRVHFVIHEAYEAPGAYLAWAALRGHEVSLTKVYRYEPLPESAADFDMLIVMGGPQSPHTTKAECPYFDAAAEIALLQSAMAADKIIIGVCLGAQLLGEAYGATVEHSPEKEIGNFPISLTDAGLADVRLKAFGKGLTVGHWHGDMLGLNETAQVLAVSQGCPRQIVKYSDKHYGFQCHLEFTQDLVANLLAQAADFDRTVQHHKYVQQAKLIQGFDYREMNEKLFSFLDSFNA
ncbi:glutamine amidotransferase-related protein [Streptococcus caviae]|uniref:glutamine amidotransferase-related protein n=1 Tax=Streptococcus sp. 'caviae' TaxID=1915004 RepID=UPI00094B7F41|nr:GMP synthase [Streptococcus sp. 'caviae']OLN83017.1 GMP synthase [Streptococcus sp. 'caviae']